VCVCVCVCQFVCVCERERERERERESVCVCMCERHPHDPTHVYIRDTHTCVGVKVVVCARMYLRAQTTIHIHYLHAFA